MARYKTTFVNFITITTVRRCSSNKLVTPKYLPRYNDRRRRHRFMRKPQKRMEDPFAKLKAKKLNSPPYNE